MSFQILLGIYQTNIIYMVVIIVTLLLNSHASVLTQKGLLHEFILDVKVFF